jgi:hypothetical protein
MNLRKFTEDFRDASDIATAMMKHPEKAQLVVRMKDGSEFVPAKVKVKRGKIIICEDEDG